MSELTTRTSWKLLGAAGLVCLTGGCESAKPTVQTTNAFVESRTFAVAPILNFSGEFDLDPVKAADLLASELSHVEGINVLPVNRVVALLATENKAQIESPAHALAVAEAVGADAIIVAGIIEYDAYTPIVGLAVQVYTRGSQPSRPALDAVTASRQARPMTLAEMADALNPAGQVQAVYNGSHKHIVDAVQRYGRSRSEGDNPLGWRQYLKVQPLYLRFCWHDAISRLMEQESMRQAILADCYNPEVSQ
ncbi:MAG: hypothetical protein ABII12_01320 [Planctomycetota bacterium]